MSLSMSSLPKLPSSTAFFAKISTNLPSSIPSSISNYQLSNLPLSNFRTNIQSASTSPPQNDYPSLSSFSQSDKAAAVKTAVTDSFNKLLISARDIRLPTLATQLIGKNAKFQRLNQNDSSDESQNVDSDYDPYNESTSSSSILEQCNNYNASSANTSEHLVIQTASAAAGVTRLTTARLCVVCFGYYNAVIKCMKPEQKCYVCNATQRLNALYAEHILPLLQEGTSCYYRSDSAVRNTSANNGRVLSWIQAEPKKVLWRSMEMRNGHPVCCGTIAASDIKSVLGRNAAGKNSIILEREARGNIEIQFTNDQVWDIWNQCLAVWHHLFLVDASIAFDENDLHLTQKAGNALRSRQNELAARKDEREERKKKYLSTGMGMKYTAEAMMNR